MEIQSWTQTNSQSSRTSSSSSSSSSTSSSPTNTHIQTNFLNNNSRSSSSSSSNSPETSFSLQIPSSPHSHKDQEYSTPPPSPQISYLAVQENNSLLYAASFNQITVFDLSNYTLTDTFGCKNPSSGLVKSISFMGDEKIFTAHQDGKIRVWEVITVKSNHETTSSSKMKHRLVSTLPTLKDRLWRGISSKNYVQIRRHEQKLWIQHADAVSGLALTEDRLLMYSISWDRSFKTWKLTSSDTDPCCTESVNNAHSDAINAIVVSPCNNNNNNNNNNNVTVYTASADGSIKVWENSKSEGKKKHKLLTTLDNRHKSRSVNAMVLNKDGSVLFSGGSDSNILAWEITNINYDRTTAAEAGVDRVRSTTLLSGHKGPILCLIYEGDFLISGSSDRTVRIWKNNNNNNGYCCVAVLEGHTKAVKSLAAIISSRNNYYNNNNNGKIIIMSIFSGSLDGEIKVWQVNVTKFVSKEKEEEEEEEEGKKKKKKIYIN